LISSLLLPDSGRISVLGYDTTTEYRQIRSKLGYMPGRFSLYSDLTVEENLSFYASVYGTSIKENQHLIEEVYSQIEPFKKRRAGKLSGGMKQKLALSCALIHSPRLLILDEPTTGVDAVSRREFWEMLKNLQSQGITVLVSTPYMDEAKRCDRIALFQKGRILKVDTPDGLVSDMNLNLYSIRSSDRYRVLNLVRNSGLVSQAYLSGQFVNYTLENDNSDQIKELLEEDGLKDLEIIKTDPEVEDCFINLMLK